MEDRSRLTEDEDYLAALSISSLASDDERSDKEDDLPLLPHIRQRKFQKALAANQTPSMKDDGEQSIETVSVEGLPRRELHHLDPGHPTYATLEQGGKLACLQFTIDKDLRNQDVVALSVYCVPHYVMDDDFMACAKKKRQRGTDFLGLQFELTMNDLSPILPQDMDENHFGMKQQRFSKKKQETKHSLSFSSDSCVSTVSQEAELHFHKVIQSIMEPETQSNLLLIASQKGNLEIVDFLLKQELFDVNEHYSSHNDWTVLHFAVSSGNEKLVRMLVQEYNSDINSRDEIGRTALHYASAKGFHEMVSILIELGADVNIKDDGDQYLGSAELGRTGKSAMDLAIESVNYHKVARAFRTAVHERETRLQQQTLQDPSNIFLQGSSISSTNPLGKVYKSSQL